MVAQSPLPRDDQYLFDAEEGNDRLWRRTRDGAVGFGGLARALLNHLTQPPQSEDVSLHMPLQGHPIARAPHYPDPLEQSALVSGAGLQRFEVTGDDERVFQRFELGDLWEELTALKLKGKESA